MKTPTPLLSLFICLFVTTNLISQVELTDNDYLFAEIDDYLYASNKDRDRSRSYFKLIKVLSEQGDSEALYYKGMLQKDGIGTKQSFKKSRRSFKESYDLGNSKAAYCLGYYYLKGFGDIQQDYQKAYRWFKRSDLPMAQHWMAKMHFLGLGKEPNKEKALKLLESNELYNSRVLAQQYIVNEPPSNGSSELLAEVITQSTISDLYALRNFEERPSASFLEGCWNGEYLELDWSKNKILRTLPIRLKLEKKEGINEQLSSEITITDSISKGTGFYNEGELDFGSFQVPIQKQYTDYPNFTHLITDIQRIAFRHISNAGEHIIIGKLNASYPVWQERANPTLVLLKKDYAETEEVQQAFKSQEDDFIRIYPNPLQEYFLLNFELSQGANVEIKITNYYNTPAYHKILFSGQKAKGNHTIEIYDPPSSPGSYLVSIAYNGKVENKIIIKS